MKLSYKNRNIILLVIGFIFVLTGFVQIIFKIKVDAKISSNIQNGLLIVAALVFVVGRKKKVENEEEVKEVKEDEDVK